MKRENLNLTQEDGYEALKGHVVKKAKLARERYGPAIDVEALHRILDDRDIVRHETVLRFDSSRLKAGEFAYAEAVSDDAGRRYEIVVHEHFEHRPQALPMLVAYHIPSVNYSDLATQEEAELFGATLMGLDLDDYYGHVCRLADEVGRPA